MTVYAFDPLRTTNARLMLEVAALGYLPGRVLDATYGEGKWWTEYRPADLVTNDLNKPADVRADYRALPFPALHFDAVCYDPPYKLSGTPALGDFDYQYGIDVPMRWQDRMKQMADGLVECCRVANLYVLMKCQNQVVSGRIRWQTRIFPEVASAHGFDLVEELFVHSGGRPQPGDRRQVHARNNLSTLLIMERRASSARPPLPAAVTTLGIPEPARIDWSATG